MTKIQPMLTVVNQTRAQMSSWNIFKSIRLIRKLFNRAKFHSYVLEFDMFVICNQLGEPEIYVPEVANSESLPHDVRLFDNFKVTEVEGLSEYSRAVHNGTVYVAWFSRITQSWKFSAGTLIIDDLAKFGLPLTDYAIKKYGL